MKKNVFIFSLTAIFLLLLLATSCNDKPDIPPCETEQEEEIPDDPDPEFPIEIPFTEYSLEGTSCQWINFQGDIGGSTVVMINSMEELKNHISCTESSYSAIDFSIHTLLLAYGIAPYFVIPNYTNLQQVSEQNYEMNVNLRPGIAAVITRWHVPIIVSKITDDNAIELILTKNP